MHTKQVIVMRKDLNMRKGKMVAQGAHASGKVFFDKIVKPIDHDVSACENHVWYQAYMEITEAMKHWLEASFTKVCVYVETEAELLELYEKAKAAHIPCALIQDSGKTEFNNVPTYTCIAVGPDEVEKVDTITRHLPPL